MAPQPSPIYPWLLALARRWQAETGDRATTLPYTWVAPHWEAAVERGLVRLRTELARQARRAAWRARLRRVLHPFH